MQGKISTATQNKLSINYGAVIIGITILLNFASMSFFYSYGVFLKPLAEELGSSRTQASLPLMIFLFSMSFSAPFIGGLLDKYPIRRIIMTATSVMSVGLILLSQIQSHLQLYIIVSLFIGISIQGVGALATNKLLTNWFYRYRGLALGASAIGLSFAAMLMPILSAGLIASFGWRTSYGIFGLAIFLIVVPLVAYLVFTRPEDKGLIKDFNQQSANTTAADTEPLGINYSSRDILLSANFWKIIIVMGIPSGVLTAMVTHVVPYLSDIGFSDLQAATLFSTIGISALFGKVFWGWLIDRFDARIAILFALAIQAGGIWQFLISASYWQFTFASVVYGLGMASIPSFQGVLVAKAFGNTSFGKVFGYTLPGMLPFTLGLIYFSASVYDHLSSYDIAFYTFIGLFLFAALVTIRLKLNKT